MNFSAQQQAYNKTDENKQKNEVFILPRFLFVLVING